MASGKANHVATREESVNLARPKNDTGFCHVHAMKSKSEAKIIAKKAKYGPLQKLKWYCEICRHQSNDEQSYRQHVQSERHRMMMTHFRANSASIIKNNSAAFESTFMDVLRRRFPNREVPANIVYTQVIRDKNHVHMNSTRWESVHGFCCHLERTGKITMRMTERGPMIRYVNREAEFEQSQQREIERVKSAETERERELVALMLKKQIQPEQDDTPALEAQHVDVVIKPENVKKDRKIAPLFAGATRAKPKAESES